MSAEATIPDPASSGAPAGDAIGSVIGDAIASAMVVGLEAGRQSGVLSIDRLRLSVIATGSDGPEDSPREPDGSVLLATEADPQAGIGNLGPGSIPESSLTESLRGPVSVQGEIEDDLQRQRSLVAELSLEVAQASAQLKSLREELKTQIQVLAEMEPGGPRGTQSSRQLDPHEAFGPATDSPDGTMDDRHGPPDPAGDAPISQAFTVSPGVLEKLAGQGVETVAGLEAYMRAGRLVPGRVKGIGQIAIDKIKDRLLEYRAKNPIPTWDDFRKDDSVPEKHGDESAFAELGSTPLTSAPPAAETRLLAHADPPGAPPEGPILEVFAVDQIIPMLDELIAEEERLELEGDDEESQPECSAENESAPEPSASGALHELQEELEDSPDLTSASQDPVVADSSITPREQLGAKDKKQAGLLFRDGTSVDMVQYRAGQKAADEMEDVGVNPHRQGTILWRSWDMGWQDRQ